MLQIARQGFLSCFSVLFWGFMTLLCLRPSYNELIKKSVRIPTGCLTQNGVDANALVFTLELNSLFGFLCVGVSRAHTHVHVE